MNSQEGENRKKEGIRGEGMGEEGKKEGEKEEYSVKKRINK